MLGVCISGAALFGLLVCVSSLAGVGLVGVASQWCRLRQNSISIALGLCLAPFLVGLVAVLILGLGPALSHNGHIVLSFAILLGLSLISWRALAGLYLSASSEKTQITAGLASTVLFSILWILVGAWLFQLLFDTLLFPLTQNDSLEYLMAARILFETRSLSSYPAVDPMNTTSGFYGPWTHPPVYVSLIYLMNCLQGSAEQPGLSRLVAPWFLYSSVFLTYAMSQVLGRLVALLSILFVLSAPLFFLGASSALTEPIVVSAMAMLLAGLFIFDRLEWQHAIVHGAVLGVGMWSHSQAILLLPIWLFALLCRHGIGQVWSKISLLFVTMIPLIALVSWPFLRNYHIFGSPISDNPVVFSLPELNFPEYFAMARGYESWPDKIQYGLLKGWFMPEAYGLLFWVMSVGVVCFFLDRRRLFQSNGTGRTLLILSTSIVGCYLSGVLFSLLLGIDLMIRNERYLLVLLIPSSVLAGYGLSRIHSLVLSNKTSFFIRLASGSIFFLAVSAIFVTFVKVQSHKRDLFGVSWKETFISHEQKLKAWSPYLAAKFLDKTSDVDDLTLALKPADMYFTQRKMISFLDPRLAPFYEAESLAEAFHKLKDLGIKFVQVVGYSLPSEYNSFLGEILASPDKTELLYSSNGSQIFRLLDSNVKTLGSSPLTEREVIFGPEQSPWTLDHLWVLGGRSGLIRIHKDSRALDRAQPSRIATDWPIFRREVSSVLVSGATSYFNDQVRPSIDSVPVEENQEYLLTLDLAGHAYAQFFLLQFDSLGKPLNSSETSISQSIKLMDWTQKIGEMAISGTARTFRKRFRTAIGARSVRVAIEHRGATWLHLGEVRLTPIGALSSRSVVR